MLLQIPFGHQEIVGDTRPKDTGKIHEAAENTAHTKADEHGIDGREAESLVITVFAFRPVEVLKRILAVTDDEIVDHRNGKDRTHKAAEIGDDVIQIVDEAPRLDQDGNDAENERRLPDTEPLLREIGDGDSRSIHIRDRIGGEQRKNDEYLCRHRQGGGFRAKNIAEHDDRIPISSG